MAKDILEDMDDDFEDDSMEDLLEDSEAASLHDSDADDMDGNGGDKKKSPFIKKLLNNAKQIPKKIFGFKKAIIISMAVFVLLILLAVGAWLYFFNPDTEDPMGNKGAAATGETVPEKQTVADEIVFEDIVDLEPFERIPMKTSSTMGLLSVTLSLELTDHRLRKQVYGMKDRIRTIVTGQIAEMTWLELRNPEGKIMLKYNLLQRINSIFPKTTVRNIYFTYFIMQ